MHISKKRIGHKLMGVFLLSALFALLLQPTNVVAAPSNKAVWENYATKNTNKGRKGVASKKLSSEQLKQKRLAEWKKAHPAKKALTSHQRKSKAKLAKSAKQWQLKQDMALIQQQEHLHSLVKRSQKSSRANPSVVVNEDILLARQRTVWQRKWDADHPAQAQAKRARSYKVNGYINTAKSQAKATTRNAARRAIQKNKTVKRIKKAAPVQLTRAQYNQRFKQRQQKNQQAKGSVKRVANNTKTTFKPTKSKAHFNRLPLEIISKLNDAGVKENGMSAYVQDVNSKQPLLAYQDQASRVPASVMKLITSYAALGVLGANYRWPLDVFAQGPIKKGTLTGDLIIKGYGAPEFNKAELRKVLKAIRSKGIHSIKGRVVFDNSYFSIPNESAAAFDGKGFASYNAQPDALLFNERISEFKIRANKKGKRVRVTTSTPTHNMKIVNKMRKTRRGCRPRIRVSHRGALTTVTFSGTFSRRCGTRSYARVISRPAEMVYGSMRAMWKRDVGGKLSTRFAMGKAPKNVKPLVRTYSRTLAEILPSIDKDSNNVMARQLLLSIGAKRTGHGTPRSGANAINQWLVSRGLNFPELRIENGSGLSRLARISARHVGDLLMDAYHSPYRNHLMQSLAIAGVDGTMKRRLRGTPVRGKGFFKTGTLKNVRSIAGYIKAANEHTYVIAILHNDPKARSRTVGAHNSLIEWVYEGGRSNTRLAQR